MSLLVIFSIIFIHWIADFVLQTDWQAQNKSKNNEALISHTYNYSLVWLVVGIPYAMLTPNYVPWTLTLFFLITFSAHTITDYFTSRLNSKLWADKKVHYFFVSVGFDQVLHYIQLFTAYYLLTN